MKRVAFVTLCLLLAGTLPVFAGGGAEGGAGGGDKPITWRVQDANAVGTARYICQEFFAEKVKEATQGKLIIELYTTEALFPTMQAVDAVKNGLVEGALTAPDYQGGREPMLKLQSYRCSDPWSDYETAEEFHAKNDQIAVRAWKNLGVTYAGCPQLQPLEAFHSNRAINGMADFKGLKVRSSGLGQELYTALGASVVAMPMGDCYQALKLNTIDAFEAGGYADNYQNATHEVVKYNIEPAPHAGCVTTNVLIVNNNSWANIPDTMKAVFPECTKTARKNSFYYLEEQNVIFKKKFEEFGVQTIQLPKADVDKMKIVAAETLKEYWGKSALGDEFLNVYIEFLKQKGYNDLANIIAK